MEPERGDLRGGGRLGREGNPRPLREHRNVAMEQNQGAAQHTLQGILVYTYLYVYTCIEQFERLSFFTFIVFPFNLLTFILHPFCLILFFPLFTCFTLFPMYTY